MASTHLDNPPIISTRLVNGSAKSVFEAFRDPEILAQWWGPKGFTCTFREFDFRPGGDWLFVMHGPDGVGYEITYNFIDIVPAGRIVLRNPQPTHEFQLTITFEEEKGSTRVTWTMQFQSPQEAARVREFVIVANEQNLDCLEEQLTTLAA
ncbi:polyketide cyclase [bacterium]|nr:MAG: polyketide cyclase [bacterium]